MDYTACIPQHFDLYIFDLDGTLIDSLDDLARAMNTTLERYGIKAVDRETVRRGLGNGAHNLVHHSFDAAVKAGSKHLSDPAAGLSPAELVALVEQALPEYRSEYEKCCVDKTVLYPGIRLWLESLKKQGSRLAVLTNKPEELAQHILKALEADSFFDCIYGPESAGKLKPEPAGILRILEETGTPPRRALMIGDSGVDIRTARNAGIASCGITGGLGDEAELRSLEPEYFIERPE